MHLTRKDFFLKNDGFGIIACLKVDLLHFATENHPKYFILAHHLRANINGFEGERIKQKLIWNSTVNLKGGHGRCITMDLCQEFQNHTFKDALRRTHGRYTKKSISRAAKLSDSFKEDPEAALRDTADRLCHTQQ